MKADETITASQHEAADKSGHRSRWLTVVFPAQSAKTYKLQGPKLTLGREPDGPGVAFPDLRMSRSHCRFEVVSDFDVVRLVDLDSKNGTYLNGRRIKSEYLESGAVVRVGETLLVYSELVDRRAEAGELHVPHGSSPLKTYIDALAAVIASRRAPVLIYGPTGAGKELLAKRLHEESGRTGPLVPVNCAALNGELLGSELFGHTAGAFSGAKSSRDGLFAAAQGGTLFFDEIGDMPLDQQPALLRVLQEQKIRPVGADREIPVDVRIISATNLDLESAIARGRFRADLLARLAQLKIELPGLAERREEILPIFSELLGPSHPITIDAAEALLSYNWPRNVRELQSLAEELKLLLGETDPVALSHLPDKLRAQRTSSDEGQDRPLDKSSLARLLEEHGGNVAEVARAIGQHRQTVYRWMRVYNLSPTEYRRG